MTSGAAAPPEPGKAPGIEEQELRARIHSRGAGSPDAKHSRDAALFSGTVTSTALGSMFGGTATQQALPCVTRAVCRLQGRAWGTARLTQGSGHTASPGRAAAALGGDRVTPRCHHCSPRHPARLFPAPMGHSSCPGRNLCSLPGFSPFRVTSCWWRGNGAGGGPSTRKHQPRIYCGASSSQLH